MNRRWFRQYLSYISRVYNFRRIINSPNDSRIRPKITLETIFVCLFMCAALRIKSFNLLESQYIKNGRLKRITGKDTEDSPSADTLDYSLVGTDKNKLFEIK